MATARTRAGTPVVLFGKLGDHIFGATEGMDGWYPNRWHLNGKIYKNDDIKVAADLEQGTVPDDLERISE